MRESIQSMAERDKMLTVDHDHIHITLNIDYYIEVVSWLKWKMRYHAFFGIPNIIESAVPHYWVIVETYIEVKCNVRRRVCCASFLYVECEPIEENEKDPISWLILFSIHDLDWLITYACTLFWLLVFIL